MTGESLPVSKEPGDLVTGGAVNGEGVMLLGTRAIGAETALAVLQTRVFDFPWEPDWRLWLILPLCGAVLLSLCGGWLGTRLLRGKALFRQFMG